MFDFTVILYGFRNPVFSEESSNLWKLKRNYRRIPSEVY